MDHPDLVTALRHATEELAPRAGFADDVVIGARKRSARNRATIAIALTGTAALVAAVVVATPRSLSDPPPGAQVTPPVKVDRFMNHQGGEHIGDTGRSTDVLEAWTAGLWRWPADPANDYDDRPGDPHVYWSGDTPYGDAAIVVERVTLRSNTERLLTGVVSTATDSPGLQLLGVQVGDPGEAGHFVLPDNRTILTIARPAMRLWVSPQILYDTPVSEREWTQVPVRDGVGIFQLPEGANPLNTRLVAAEQDVIPNRRNAAASTNLSLALTVRFPVAVAPQPFRRGLPWRVQVDDGQVRELFDPAEHFVSALRMSEKLDPYSYREQQPPWLISMRSPAGFLIIGEKQELDQQAYIYALTSAIDGTSTVERLAAADPDALLPVVYRISEGGGWVVAAIGKQFSYRTSQTTTWSNPIQGLGTLPPDATQVRVGGQIVDLS